MQTSIQCERVRELASEYIEGTLPAAMQQAVAAHLDTCPACASDFTALESLWGELNGLPMVDTPLFFHENVMTAVERAPGSSRGLQGWRALLPQIGRVGVSTLLMGGAVAAIAYTLLLPPQNVAIDSPNTSTRGGYVDLPGISQPQKLATTTNAPGSPINAPALRVARTTTIDPEHGPSYEFTLWLQNADSGTARVHIMPDATLKQSITPVRMTLKKDSGQPVRVPYSLVRGDTMNLYVYWTANGEPHEKWLFVPLPRTDSLPSEKQSFGLPETRLTLAAREMASRYGQAITLEDIQDLDRVTIIPRQETASEALNRALQNKGIVATASHSGILIEKSAVKDAEPR